MGLFSWLFGSKKPKENNSKTEENKNIIGQKNEENIPIENKALKNKPDNEPDAPASLAKNVSQKPAKPSDIKFSKNTSTTNKPSQENEKAEIKETPSVKNDSADIKVDNHAESQTSLLDTSTAKSDTPDVVSGHFEINKSKDGKKYFFNLYASNKVGIATSQMYSSAQSALIGIKSVIANAAKAPIEDQTLKTYEELPFPKWIIYIDKGGKYRFHLSAANGSNICHSQGYTSKSSCKNGIESIIRSSKNPQIDKAYLLRKEC